MAAKMVVNLLVVALVCASVAYCAATPNFGDHRGRFGVRVHVDAMAEGEDTTIKIQNRLPQEDKDVLAISCTAESEGKSIGDLSLEEFSPYATIWGPDLYGPADLWYCQFEWVGTDVVIDRTDIWKKDQGSVTWKLDGRGLAYFDASNDSYEFIKEWKPKSSGSVASA